MKEIKNARLAMLAGESPATLVLGARLGCKDILFIATNVVLVLSLT